MVKETKYYDTLGVSLFYFLYFLVCATLGQQL